MFDKKAIKAAACKDQPHLWPILLNGKRRAGRRLHHRLRRGHRQDPRDRDRRDGDQGQAPHLDPRRRPFRRGQGDLADELGCHYVRRLSSGGAKAGNINHALSIAKGDFFCVFDADFVPKPEFLVETRAVLRRTATSPSSRRRRPTAT